MLDKPATPNPEYTALQPDPATGTAPYRIFNIGNNQPTPLMEFIAAMEESLGITAQKNFLPMQPGDVPATAADTDRLDAWVGFKPNTPIRQGVSQFVSWYRDYYAV